MAFEIEIVEGNAYSSYFKFRPVLIKESPKIILDDDIKEFDVVFSIEEGYMEYFLSHFLFKFFDENILINKNRFEYGIGFIKEFEWHLTHNFYTYKTLKIMIEDILLVANLLENDYGNPYLDDIKNGFSIFYMTASEDEDHVAASLKVWKSFKEMLDGKNEYIINRHDLAIEREKNKIIGSDLVIKKHVGVVIDFYRRFAYRLQKMMENNPQTNLISIMGP